MKIYVINLKRRVDRLDMMKIQLRNFNFEVVEAVDGETVDFNEYEAKPYVDWVDPIIGRNLTRGEMATTLSHIEVWKKIASDNVPGVVLEDDNELIGNIDLKELYLSMFDCDMLYLS